VRKLRLKNQVLDNVAKAYVNVRLRRHHELDVGKQWIQRARQADDTDENDHEKDRLNYTKFCLGLERLDVAALQLDDTLLALNDFC
jgi:DNA-directed RNA polymerase III subunit RPC3